VGGDLYGTSIAFIIHSLDHSFDQITRRGFDDVVSDAGVSGNDGTEEEEKTEKRVDGERMDGGGWCSARFGLEARPTEGEGPWSRIGDRSYQGSGVIWGRVTACGVCLLLRCNR